MPGMWQSSTTTSNGSPARTAACIAASASAPEPACSQRHVARSQVRVDDRPVGDVVVDDQDAQARGHRRARAAGRARAGTGRSEAVKVKRLPAPGSDSTPISPPISSTSWREIARPRPVPP